MKGFSRMPRTNRKNGLLNFLVDQIGKDKFHNELDDFEIRARLQKGKPVIFATMDCLETEQGHKPCKPCIRMVEVARYKGTLTEKQDFSKFSSVSAIADTAAQSEQKPTISAIFDAPESPQIAGFVRSGVSKFGIDESKRSMRLCGISVVLENTLTYRNYKKPNLTHGVNHDLR